MNETWWKRLKKKNCWKYEKQQHTYIHTYIQFPVEIFFIKFFVFNVNRFKCSESWMETACCELFIRAKSIELIKMLLINFANESTKKWERTKKNRRKERTSTIREEVAYHIVCVCVYVSGNSLTVMKRVIHISQFPII